MEANILSLLQKPDDKATQTKHKTEYSKKMFPLNKTKPNGKRAKQMGLSSKQRKQLISELPASFADVESHLKA